MHWQLVTTENAIAQFWHQPTQRILRIWHGIKRRRREEVNSYSVTNATLTANVVSFLRSFGNSEGNLPSRDDYLPYRFLDFNSPKYKLRQKLSPDAIALAARLIDEGKIPPKLVKILYSVEGFVEILEEEASSKK